MEVPELPHNTRQRYERKYKHLEQRACYSLRNSRYRRAYGNIRLWTLCKTSRLAETQQWLKQESHDFSRVECQELADYVRKNSRATVVIGGLHATLNYAEAASHCDYVLVGEGDEPILRLIDCIKNAETMSFAGVAYKSEDQLLFTGCAEPPVDIDVIPARELLYNYQKMAGHSTVWPQVHASRGCPHKCDYCALVHAFGRGVRTRSPQNVVTDIKAAIVFHHDKHSRMAKVLWLTDDNFFADREWAMSVLKAIISKKIKYNFTIQ